VKLKRKELIRESKGVVVDRIAQQQYNSERWRTCQLTNRKLQVPVVSDYKGLLYNKEAILEYLVDPMKYSEKQKELVKHIQGLKDVVEVKLNGFECPITGNELGTSGLKYVYLVKCGDMFAEKCLKLTKECPVCGDNYVEDDIIILNPVEQDLQLLQKRMDKLRSDGLTHSLKKAKRKKHSQESTNVKRTKET
jgi:hypothetical protein